VGQAAIFNAEGAEENSQRRRKMLDSELAVLLRFLRTSAPSALNLPRTPTPPS